MHSALTAVPLRQDTARPRREEPGDLLHRDVSVASTAPRIRRICRSRDCLPHRRRPALHRPDGGWRSPRPPSMPWRGRVQMVFTSPPFPLVRKKKYGNLSGDAFAKWLASFATGLTQFLTPDGSIVIEFGNGWNPGSPDRLHHRHQGPARLSGSGRAAFVPGVHLLQPGPAAHARRVGDGAADARQGRLHAGVVARAERRRPRPTTVAC